MKNILILFFSFTLCTVYCVVHTEDIWARVVYYHSDHLGSSSVLTDDLGGISGEMQYYPYGTIFLDTRVDITPHTYTGQEEDGETGLYYYGARYYDSLLGKFLSPDPLVDPFTPQDLNTYQYVHGNPLRIIDPDGNAEFEAKNDWDLMQYFIKSRTVPQTGDTVFLGDDSEKIEYHVYSQPITEFSNAFRVILHSENGTDLHLGFNIRIDAPLQKSHVRSPAQQVLFENFLILQHVQEMATAKYGSEVFVDPKFVDNNGNVIVEVFAGKGMVYTSADPKSLVGGFHYDIYKLFEDNGKQVILETQRHPWNGSPASFGSLENIPLFEWENINEEALLWFRDSE